MRTAPERQRVAGAGPWRDVLMRTGGVTEAAHPAANLQRPI